MKKLLLASALTALTFSAAQAADAIIYSEPAPSPISHVSVYDWSGAYLGVNVGYGGGNAKHPYGISGPNIATGIDGSLDITSSGFLGGVQAGWNFQSNQLVYGIEADFQGSNVKGVTNFSLNLPAPVGGINAEVGTKLNWFGTVRGRIGYAVTDRFLAYATGGLAYGSTKSFVNVSAAGTSLLDESVKKTKAGWTVGAGVEYAVTDNWSVKTEYLYTDLGKANLFSYNDPSINAAIDRKFNFHTARIGFNYKF